MAYTKARENHSLRAKACSQRERKGLIYQNWWVLLFIAICCFVYFNSISGKNVIIGSLDQHLNTLKAEKTSLVQEKEDLLSQINSQSDPAWIRLTLMKGLGLVPDGQLKVYFHREND